MSSSPLPDSAPPALPSPRPARPAEPVDRTVRWGLAIALIVAVAAIALAWDARQSFSSLSQSSGGRLAELGNEVAQSKAALAQAQVALKDSQARLAEVETRLADAQESRVAVEDMYRELARSTDDRMLAEVEQLLILASQQLQLAGNVKGALIALEAADQRLSRADKLQAASLRRALNQDMERLKALPLVDTVGLAVKLDGLVQQADTLPLVVSESLPPARPPSRAKAAEEAGWLRVLRDFWEEMKGLVKIRELETQEAALVSPAQAYFLRQNLKLRLLAARVALLARDEASYRDDVKAAQAWIAKYFDAKARPTVAAQGTLKQLADGHVSIVVPDINTSLAAVRAARSAREKQR